VLGDLQAPGAKDPHATDRHHVRGHEHRVGAGSAVQKLLHGLCTTLGTEVTLDDKTLVDLDPGLLHGLPVPAESFHTGVHVERAGDGGDPAATDVQKTLGRRTPAPDVADLDVVRGRHVRVLRQPPVDHRDPGLGQAFGQRVVTVERDQKSTVDVKTAQVVSDTLVL